MWLSKSIYMYLGVGSGYYCLDKSEILCINAKPFERQTQPQDMECEILRVTDNENIINVYNISFKSKLYFQIDLN